MDWAAIRTEGLANFTMAIMPPTIQLPALPHAVTLFLERSSDEAATSKDLAEVIETDTGLTFELLKYVNSSFMGLRQQAKTVFQALSLLGRRQSRMLVMATGAQASMRARKSKLINQQAFWNACLQKALFAREIAQLLQTDADVAFSGALLQDYLLPVLTNDLIDTYLEFVQQRETFPETLCEFEHNRFEWDHALAGACLAHRWNLPDELVCCILYHHSGLRILRIRNWAARRSPPSLCRRCCRISSASIITVWNCSPSSSRNGPPSIWRLWPRPSTSSTSR